MKLSSIAITMGDPAGIGPELCLRLLSEPVVLARCVPVVFGDARVLRSVARRCNLPGPARVVPLDAWEIRPVAETPTVVDCAQPGIEQVRPGSIDGKHGRAAFAYIEASIRAALAGHVAGICTAPLHKEALKLAGFPYPGHTEIFTALTGARRSCMMLASDELAVSMVTLHIGYAEVPARLTTARILDVIELTADAIRSFRRAPSKILVCGLNPHAGEHGLFGSMEEQRLIEPAIAEARARGIEAEGPVSPDAAFLPERRPTVGAYVCMYHDQGHIPFKMLAFDKGVNITLGLPIIRTSVDHGTAFDIAWTGKADPSSMIQATLWAARLAVFQTGS